MPGHIRCVEACLNAGLNGSLLHVAVDRADVRAEVQPPGSGEVSQSAKPGSLTTHLLNEVNALFLEAINGLIHVGLVAKMTEPAYVETPELQLHLAGRNGRHVTPPQPVS